MPFTVFSWNLQRLTKNNKRMKHVEKVIERYKPDIMFVSEVSHDVSFPGYNQIGHALAHNVSRALGTEPVNNQLNTKLFQRIGSAVVVAGGRSLRQGEGQPRAMIKAHVADGANNYQFSFVHSKAKKESAARTLMHLKAQFSEDGNHVVLGDINSNADEPGALAAAGSGGHNVVLMRDSAGAIAEETHRSSRSQAKLDYLVGSAKLKVKALNARVDTRRIPLMDSRRRGAGLRKMPKRRGVEERFLRLSDHRPVVYRIG